jgi:hypothetical protein
MENVIPHPGYGHNMANLRDVAVLIFEEAVDLPVASLPDEGLLGDLKKDRQLLTGPDGTKFTLVGYGGSLDWPPPGIYYEGLRQVSTSEYRALTKAWLHMSQNQATGDGGTCYGDSGGPAFWTDPDTGEEILVGITSWGDIPCVASGINYRTDIPDTLDFVADMISSLE